MFEPDHWTKQNYPQFAKKGEEQNGAPAAKPEPSSVTDLARAIETIKDGLRALADQVAELAITKKWWAFMRDIMAADADNVPVQIPLKRVCYLA